jgi:hypothetical protein
MLTDITVQFACENPKCTVGYSWAISGPIFSDVDQLRKEYSDIFMPKLCWRCASEFKINVESIKAKLVFPERKKFEITWRCESCGRSWVQTTWLTEEDVKDKDVILHLREKTRCMNPGCDPSKNEYYITNIVRMR